MRPVAYSGPVTCPNHTRLETDVALVGNVRQTLDHPARPGQPSHTGGRGRIDASRLAELHLLEERPDLQPLHHLEAFEQRQIRYEHVGDAAPI